MTAPLQPWRPMVSASNVTAQLHEVDARVEGRLPEWLAGTLMRTAPAIFELGAWRADHWFDGLGMMFSFTFAPHGCRFRQRLLDTRVYRAAQKGRVDVSTFGSRNERGFFTRLFEPIPRTTDNTNVNTLKVGSDWHVYTETQPQQ